MMPSDAGERPPSTAKLLAPYMTDNPIQLQAGGVAIENRVMGLGLDKVFARTRVGITESYLTDALGSSWNCVTPRKPKPCSTPMTPTAIPALP